MDFNTIKIGDKVSTSVLGGIVKECVVLDKKPAGGLVNWTTSHGNVVKLRVIGSKGRLYIVRSADQLSAVA